MAELVDALVSNTNGAIRAGSIPALGTKVKINSSVGSPAEVFYYICVDILICI